MEIHSRVISVWLGSSSGALITEPPRGFLAEAWLRALEGDEAAGRGQEPEQGREQGREQGQGQGQGDAAAQGPQLDWVEVCGLTSEVGASYTGAWDLTACTLQREPPPPGHPQGHPQGLAQPRANVSRCSCNRPGTIALLLVAQQAKVSAITRQPVPATTQHSHSHTHTLSTAAATLGATPVSC